MALCCEPELLIADEPTTALDVSIQSQILDLIKRLTKERNLAVILITHDMGVISETTSRVAVMKNGDLVEIGPTKEILTKPKEIYTKALVSSVPPTNKKIDRFKIIENFIFQWVFTNFSGGFIFFIFCIPYIKNYKY